MHILRSLKNWNLLAFLIHPGERLAQRVAYAGFWMTFLHMSGRGLGMVRVVILARILSTEAFGLVAVAILVVEFLDRISVTGFTTALVQRKGEIEEYLDTVWVLNIVRGLLLGVVIFLSAPFAVFLFDVPEAAPIIKIMALAPVIRGFTSPGVIYFIKELEVRKRFIWEISSVIAEMAVAITFAVILRNAWAIVLGILAGRIISLAVSFFIHPYRPHLRFKYQQAKELFSFGIWVLLFSLFFYFSTRFDSLYVGRLFGTSALGIYTMAYTVIRPVADEMVQIANVIVFPAYAKIQENAVMLRQATLAALEIVALVTFPLAVVIYILAPDFIPLILGDKWMEVVPVLQILGIATAMYSLHNVGGSLFWGLGKPKYRFFLLATASVIMAVFLFLLSGPYGITGAALAVVIGNGGGLIFLLIALRLILKIKIRDVIKRLSPSLLLCIVLSVILVLINFTLHDVGIGELILLLFVTAVVYAGFSVIAWKFFKTGPISIVQWFSGSKITS